MYKTRSSARSGFTLIELILASLSATILIGGLASSIFIASRALHDDDGIAFRKLSTSLAADEILSDLQFAKRFRERTKTAVEFTVPDRDSDGIDEVIRYAWSGKAGDPITREINGGNSIVILENVHQLNLEFMSRELKGIDEPVIGDGQPRYLGFAAVQQDTAAESIALTLPAGVVLGDLLVAAVAVDNDVHERLEDPIPGWTLAGTSNRGNQVSLGVWWRVATGAEEAETVIRFGESVRAYGWVMQFVGQDAAAPLAAVAFDDGDAEAALTPGVSTTSDKALVLRLGAFENSSLPPDSVGIDKHTTITMDGAGQVSGGAAFTIQAASGPSGSAAFQLTEKESFVTATMVITPVQGP